MKAFIIFILMSFAFINLFSKSNETEVKTSKIDYITVYFSKAEIHSSALVKLNEGENLIRFKNISPNVVSNNIRISSDAEISIISITTQKHYLQKAEYIPKIENIQDSIKILQFEKTSLTDEKSALKAELEFLKQNQEIGGDNSGINLTDLTNIANYYRKRNWEIFKRISEIDAKLLTINTLLSKYTYSLSKYKSLASYQRVDILIYLTSAKEITTTLKLDYLVEGAGWTPVYEIKAKDLNEKIEFSYLAQIFNKTQIDWENANLLLSTADPSQNATQPILSSWYLNFYNISSFRNKYKSADNFGYLDDEVYDSSKISSNGKFDKLLKTQQIVYEQVEISQLAAEFKIEKTYNILSDGKPYLVQVADYQFPASFKHFAVPKLEKAAYLIAQITGWKDLNLIDGPASIYFDGNYIGQSNLYIQHLNDTLKISFGRDKKVIIDRTKLKDYCKTSVIGNKRKETLTFETIVKNNRNVPIEIEILDQIPVSQNSEIEVELLEKTSGELIENTGEIKWIYNIKPDQSKKINLSFAIKYPKNKSLQLEQNKTMWVPRYL